MKVELPCCYNHSTRTPRKHLPEHCRCQSWATVVKLIEELDEFPIVKTTDILSCQLGHAIPTTLFLMQNKFSPSGNKAASFTMADQVHECLLSQPRSMC